MDVTAGMRLRSVVDATEIVVVKASGEAREMRCGGHPMTLVTATAATELSVVPGFDQGTHVGKRYADTSGTIEVLCTKSGIGSLSWGDELLTVRLAKALPSSD